MNTAIQLFFMIAGAFALISLAHSLYFLFVRFVANHIED